jgi:sec-independent protein translocase protein TatA
MPFGIHPGFLLVLLIIVLITFGPGKLPDIGSAVGRGIREFRKESDRVLDDAKSSADDKASPASPPSTEPVKTGPPEARS